MSTNGSVFKKVAPKKAEREACWKARDAFWDCIKSAYSRGKEVPEELSDTVNISQCKALRVTYKAVCPESWVSSAVVINKTCLIHPICIVVEQLCI